MDLPIYQVDAFTDRLFRGNPAAVVPLDDWLPDPLLQDISAENNLSETAFFVPLPPGHAGGDFLLRWFTPLHEVDLCGHATLASAHVLFTERGWDGPDIRFATNQAGPLTVRRDGNRLQLDFPARVPAAAPAPPGLDAALGRPPAAFLKAVNNMAVFESADAVRLLDPDLGFIARMAGDGLIVTAPGDDCDCVSRYFAPHAGIPEDPVTGSAHCTIVPYWADRLGKPEIHARQVSARGGELHCRLAGDRVVMAGDARLYLTGRIRLA